MTQRAEMMAILARIYGVLTIFFGILILIFALVINLLPQAEKTTEINNSNIQGGMLTAFIAGRISQPVKTHSTKPVQGGMLTAFLAEKYANPQNPQIKGGQKTVFLVESLSEIEPSYSPDFEAIVVLQRIVNVLTLDPETQFEKDSDRGQAIEDHVIYLTNLYNEGANAYSKIQNERIVSENELTATSNAASDAESNFFAYLNQYRPDGAEQYFNNFKEQQKKAVELRADVGYLMAMEERLQYNLNKLQERIAYLQSNKETLICANGIAN